MVRVVSSGSHVPLIPKILLSLGYPFCFQVGASMVPTALLEVFGGEELSHCRTFWVFTISVTRTLLGKTDPFFDLLHDATMIFNVERLGFRRAQKAPANKMWQIGEI